jgi:hypothetical protein
MTHIGIRATEVKPAKGALITARRTEIYVGSFGAPPAGRRARIESSLRPERVGAL